MVGAIYKVVGGYIQNIVGDGGSNIYEVLAALDIFKKKEETISAKVVS